MSMAKKSTAENGQKLSAKITPRMNAPSILTNRSIIAVILHRKRKR
jgi:hypothetical protein